MITTIREQKEVIDTIMDIMQDLPFDRIKVYYIQSKKSLGRVAEGETIDDIEISTAKCEEMLRFIKNGIILFDMKTLETFLDKVKIEKIKYSK